MADKSKDQAREEQSRNARREAKKAERRRELDEKSKLRTDTVGGETPTAWWKVALALVGIMAIFATSLGIVVANNDSDDRAQPLATTTTVDPLNPTTTVDPSSTTPADQNSIPDACPDPASYASRADSIATAPSAEIASGSIVNVFVFNEAGTFNMQLDPAGAPEAVSAFVGLAQQGFYDGLQFFDTSGERISSGDPTNTGDGDAGFELQASSTVSQELGSIALLPKGDGVGSQYAILASDSGTFPDGSVIIGKVTSSFDAVTTIGADVPGRYCVWKLEVDIVPPGE
jgi:peptidyl-prolyl cis-trans isomerase B (cyclophilin B)